MKLNSKKIIGELKRLNLSIPAFAKAIGMSRQGIYYCLQNESTSWDTVDRFAKFFCLAPKDLIK